MAVFMQPVAYVCPPDKAIVLTVKQHPDALAPLAQLVTAGIDAEVVAQISMPPGYLGEPRGPWHIVVPTRDFARASACLVSPVAGSQSQRATDSDWNRATV